MANYGAAFTIPQHTHDQRYDITYPNPSSDSSWETISSVLIVDSQYRDNPSTTTANDYTVTLTNKYPDTISIELVFADIPNSNYNIDSFNNTLHVMPVGPISEITYVSGGIKLSTLTESLTLASPIKDVSNGLPYTDSSGIPGAEFTVTRDVNGHVSDMTVTAGGFNFVPGESVTITAPGADASITAIVTETSVQTLTVPPGLYTPVELASSIQALLEDLVVLEAPLTALDLSGAWDVNIIDQDTANSQQSIGISSITSTQPIHFGIKVISSGTTYNTNTIAHALGYKPTNKSSESFVLLSDYPVKMEMDNYISMFIEGMERCDGNQSHVHGAFCIVPLDSKSANFGMVKDSNIIDNDTFRYYYNQPHKLAKLHIYFKDWQGHPYDFNGLNHLLIFKVDTTTHKRKFTFDNKRH